MDPDDATKEALCAENAALRRRVAELEDIEAKLRALCAITTDHICVIDSEGRYVEVLPTQSPFVGPMRQLIGAKMSDVIPKAAADSSLESLRLALSTGGVFSQEASTPSPEGEMWVASRLTRLTDTTALWVSQETTMQHRLARAEAERAYFQALAENTPVGVSLSWATGALFYANPAYRAMTGQGDALIGKTLFDIYTEPREVIAGAQEEVLTQGTFQGLLTIRHADGTILPCDVAMVRLSSIEGGKPVCAAIIRDLTQVHKAEQENLALKEQLIASQQAMLSELSTPIIPVAKGVIAIPLVGVIDSGRAEDVLSRLLRGIVEQHSHAAILDITGVKTVDAAAAAALMRVAQAARLLGTQIIVTGIQPSVAQVLVNLDVDLRGTVTLGDLESGIAYAMKLRQTNPQG